MSGLATLRQALDNISFSDASVPQQVELLAALARRLPHTIQRLKHEVHPKWNYNCYSYAFGLAGSRGFTEIAHADNLDKETDRFYSSDAFADYLIAEEVLTGLGNPESECIVVYSEDPDKLPTHAGIVTDTDPVRVKSKWGPGGFWKHGLWEVPQSYGNHVRYFEPISTERAEKAFIAFCKTYLGFEAFCEKHSLTDALK